MVIVRSGVGVNYREPPDEIRRVGISAKELIINPLLANIVPCNNDTGIVSGDLLQYKQQSKKQKTKILFAQIKYT